MNNSAKPNGRQRLQYVADLNGEKEEDLPVRGEEFHSLTWDGEGIPEAAIARIRSGVEKRFAELVRSLVHRQLLTEAEAAALERPSIQVMVHDMSR